MNTKHPRMSPGKSLAISFSVGSPVPQMLEKRYKQRYPYTPLKNLPGFFKFGYNNVCDPDPGMEIVGECNINVWVNVIYLQMGMFHLNNIRSFKATCNMWICFLCPHALIYNVNNFPPNIVWKRNPLSKDTLFCLFSRLYSLFLWNRMEIYGSNTVCN